MSAASVMAMDGSQNQTDLDGHVIKEQELLDVVMNSKLTAQSRRKSPKSGVVEEDFDDSASMSSGISSASEHSTKSDPKVKKVKRQRCQIHSKSSQTKLIEMSGNNGSDECGKRLDDEDDANGNDTECTENVQCRCACLKNSANKLSGKSRVLRPEPEGSILSDPSKACFLDDLERVIYSNEPLFSDAEDEDPTLEDQIRAESERFHRRVTRPENVFSAVQMLNTNTMMKLAIIQTELKNVKDISLRRSEGEIVSAAKRAELLRESFEHTENSFKSVASQLSEASKAISAFEISHPASNRVAVDNKKQKDKEQQKMTSVSPDVVSQRRSFGGKHLVNDVDLETAECNLEAAELTISEIEEEQMVISNAVKSRNTSEFEEIIRRLSQRLGQAEKQARDSEQVILYLGHQMRDIQGCYQKHTGLVKSFVLSSLCTFKAQLW